MSYVNITQQCYAACERLAQSTNALPFARLEFNEDPLVAHYLAQLKHNIDILLSDDDMPANIRSQLGVAQRRVNQALSIQRQ